MAKRKSRQVKISAEKLAEYRRIYKLAKEAGLVTKKVAPSKLRPSKYMRTRLNSLKQYLTGEYEFLKADTPKRRKTAELFRKAPTPFVPKVVNKVIIGKKQGSAKLTWDNAILKRIRHLDAGEFENIPMPIKPRDLNDLRDFVEKNPYLNDVLKHDDEVFNFVIFGNKSIDSYGDLESLVRALEDFYDTENFPEDWASIHLELFRSYKDWKHEGNSGRKGARNEARRMADYRARIAANPAKYARYREYANAAFRASPGYTRKLERQKKNRDNETPEQREKRLEYQRKRRKDRKGKK